MGEGDCGNCNGCDCGSGLRHEIIEYGRRLERAWSRETAAPSCQDRWTRENNALGQGAVTALLIQDKFGGDLIRTEVAGHGSHYFNRLPNGWTVDFTIQQFPDGAQQAPEEVRTRGYVLDSPGAVAARTRERYELLKAALEKIPE